MSNNTPGAPYGDQNNGQPSMGSQFDKSTSGASAAGQQYPSQPQGGYTSQGYGQGEQQNQAGYDQSAYGQAGQQYPQAQYGQGQYDQSQFGAQQQYGQQQYGFGQPGAMGAPAPYASWGKRVLGSIVDAACVIPFIIIVAVGMGMATSGLSTTTDPVTGTTTTTGNMNGGGLAIATIGYLGAFVFGLWNQVFKQGKTGQSIGKGVAGIKLIDERTGQPMGAGMCFVRQLAHILDSLPCEIGYLWPLWDAKRQTFADKVMNTIVVDSPKV